jgi:hypothetical protein
MDKHIIYRKIGEIARENDCKKQDKMKQDLKLEAYMDNEKKDLADIKDFIKVKIGDISDKDSEEAKRLKICEDLISDYQKYKKVSLPRNILVPNVNIRNEKGNTVRKDETLKKGKEMIIINSFSNGTFVDGDESYEILDPDTNYIYFMKEFHLKKQI